MKHPSFLLLCVLFPLSLAAQTQPVISFLELQAALGSGKTVRVAIYYAQCTAVSNGRKIEKAREVVSGFTVNSFESIPKNSGKGNKEIINFSDCRLNEAGSGKGYVYDLVKLSVYDDGKVLIFTHSISPLTFESEFDGQYEADMFEREGENAGVYFYTTD